MGYYLESGVFLIDDKFTPLRFARLLYEHKCTILIWYPVLHSNVYDNPLKYYSAFLCWLLAAEQVYVMHMFVQIYII